MPGMLTLDHFTGLLVAQRFAAACVGGAHESHIVHAQRSKVVSVAEFNLFSRKNFTISCQVDAFVIDDDAVEVKEDCLDHDLNRSFLPSPFGRRAGDEGLRRRVLFMSRWSSDSARCRVA